MYVLVHLWAALGRGSKEHCERARDMLITNGNERKHFIIMLETEYEEIWKDKNTCAK